MKNRDAVVAVVVVGLMVGIGLAVWNVLRPGEEPPPAPIASPLPPPEPVIPVPSSAPPAAGPARGAPRPDDASPRTSPDLRPRSDGKALAPPAAAAPVPPAAAAPQPSPAVRPVAPEGLAVAEAVLCKGVDRENRKPVDATAEFRVADGRIWCFVRLTGGAGRKVRVVWRLGGKTYPGVLLKAGPDAPPAADAPAPVSWRTWWYKELDEDMAGEGAVDVVDESGGVLKTLAVRVDR